MNGLLLLDCYWIILCNWLHQELLCEHPPKTIGPWHEIQNKQRKPAAPTVPEYHFKWIAHETNTSNNQTYNKTNWPPKETSTPDRQMNPRNKTPKKSQQVQCVRDEIQQNKVHKDFKHTNTYQSPRFIVDRMFLTWWKHDDCWWYTDIENLMPTTITT